MKHIKTYENLNNEPKVGDYILYKSSDRMYYILKIISITDNTIELKPFYEIYNGKITKDNRSIIVWSSKTGDAMKEISSDVVYFSDELKNAIKHFKLINSANKYNL